MTKLETKTNEMKFLYFGKQKRKKKKEKKKRKKNYWSPTTDTCTPP
jgi:hypothetical protein